MNVAHKRVNCLSNIPQRDNTKVAHPKAATGLPHEETVNKAITSGFLRYNKAIDELAKV